MLLVYKLCFTPLLIACITLAGRRWGPTISGLLIGLALTSGPISLLFAVEYGRNFAAQAAVGSLVGQASFCLFCLTYAIAAPRWTWLISALSSLFVFVSFTLVWNCFSWSLLPAAVLLLLVIALGVWCLPRQQTALLVALHRPRWDLPARMIIASVFVLLVTAWASFLGPQLSGLLTPFPTSGLVMAAFTHHQQGSAVVTRLLRGNIVGSLTFAAFFVVLGLGMPSFGLIPTYLVATLVVIGMGAVSWYCSG